MLNNVTYFLIFGKPLIMYAGIVVLICFLTTATIGAMLFKGSTKVSIKAHRTMAAISIALGIIHATLGVLAFF